MERLLEDLSFDAPDLGKQEFVIDGDRVRERLSELVDDQAPFIHGEFPPAGDPGATAAVAAGQVALEGEFPHHVAGMGGQGLVDVADGHGGFYTWREQGPARGIDDHM